MKVLSCAVCGAPLPDVRGVVRCRHCGMRADGGDAEPALDPDERSRRGVAAALRLFEAKQRGAEIEVGLAEAAKELLGPAAETDELARIVAAIGRDFARESGLSDPLSHPASAERLLSGYLAAIERIAAEGSTVLSLPYFGVGPRGPVHLERKLDRATLAALAARRPEPPKKKGWWPFG